MALQLIPGIGVPIPVNYPGGTPALSTVSMSASTHKIAFVGRFAHKDRVAKNIHKVGFLAGAITSAGGTTLRVSLQDVSLTTGAPMQPDGTQDQTVDTLLSALTANSWNQLGVLSADRNTVTPGDLLAIVFEFTGYGGADSLAVKGMTAQASGPYEQSVFLLNTGSWATQAAFPNVVLECSDGTFGTLKGAWVCSDISTLGYNNGSNPDENAFEFQVPYSCKIDTLGVAISTGASGDFTIAIYDGTSIMTSGSIAVDGNSVAVNGSGRMLEVPLAAEVTLVPNHTYRIAIRPDTANNVTVSYFDVSANGHFQCHWLGTIGILNSRVDAGAWGGGTNTRRPFIWFRESSLDDGVSVGGGLMVHPGLNGGARG